ncbi:PepSY domain-containing protein [Hydrogenimonas urashimensis]|uniref:PepSY domain-containing protein n=1 Tax=Hydrogenimonas urashimensis TaxID=2740515 RepID=UPI00191565BE|nr:PepSY domain-containing protein [Hydrogenimonas urashimensis]
MANRFIVLTTLLCMESATLCIAEGNITPQEHNRFHNSNFRPTIRLQKARAMQDLAAIDKNEAKTIARRACPGSSIEKIALRHQNNLLYWQATTTSCRLKIDAVNGTILEKERK